MRKNAPRKTKPVENPYRHPIVNKDVTHKLSEDFYRPKTMWYETPINFFVSRGGLGDYLNWVPAFKWIAEKNHHVKSKIFIAEPMATVYKYIFKDHKNIIVFSHKDITSEVKNGEAVCNMEKYELFINATGGHLMDLGFMYLCTSVKPYPGYDKLPVIDYKETPDDLLPQKPYAVFTPGATHKTRQMPAKAFNELVQYTYELGITPVFLGKKDFAEGTRNIAYIADFLEEYDYSCGFDLREQTTLLQSTQIMAGAEFVLGIDNGLLHFAGCTSVPVIFGHTITEVWQRDLRRVSGKTINITLDKKDLPCIGCQANMRFIMGHNFSKCIYDDYKCLELLFANNSETWKLAIKSVLEK